MELVQEFLEEINSTQRESDLFLGKNREGLYSPRILQILIGISVRITLQGPKFIAVAITTMY